MVLLFKMSLAPRRRIKHPGGRGHVADFVSVIQGTGSAQLIVCNTAEYIAYETHGPRLTLLRWGLKGKKKFETLCCIDRPIVRKRE